MTRTRSLLQVVGLEKSFAETRALRGASLTLQPGEIHGLVGENGAGKSTLMKVVAGVLQPDRGHIRWKDRACRIPDPAAARQMGIAMIHQELSLVPQLSIAENLLLGRWPKRGGLFLERKRMEETAARALSFVGLKRSPQETVGNLSLAERQMVEVARALAGKSELVIMDEPTSSLSRPEVEALLDRISQLAGQGVAFLYVSHRLDEVSRICHRVSVMRDGETVIAADIGDLPRAEMIRWMAGRELKPISRRRSAPAGPVLLRLENVSVPPLVKQADFSVRSGEVLGLGGLVGAGRTELVMGIFGARPLGGGQVWLDDRPLRLTSPAQAVRRGIGLLSEDRRLSGLLPTASIHHNLVLGCPDKYARFSFFDQTRERRELEELSCRIGLTAHGLDAPAGQLSGGNQQKVVLARWIYAEARILILDEPTRGIDVQAKNQISNLILELRDKGVAVILISSEIEELLELCDRILVMREGRIRGELSGPEATEAGLLQLAMGETA